VITYEYPLSERIRTLLRLEDLFERVFFFTSRADSHEHHVALLNIFEILEVSGRADLKSDLLQELERQKQILDSLHENPDISEEALDTFLWEIDRTSGRLFQTSGKIGQELRDNEWLMSIKQRTTIPGGMCEFDVPSYHYWLHLPDAQRRRDLEAWSAPFLPIREGIAIVLKLLRESGRTTREIAHQGVYQQMMAGRVAQMIRLRLDPALTCVPEVSANKYALNIRFTTQEGLQRPRAVEGDVGFELTFCNL
jgi:cell division protein ZapD